MSLDAATVRRIARLARSGIGEDEIERVQGELNRILGWIEQLSEVNIEVVAPMAGVEQAVLRLREDTVTDGDGVEAVLSNASGRAGPFFTVPKVVE